MSTRKTSSLFKPKKAPLPSQDEFFLPQPTPQPNEAQDHVARRLQQAQQQIQQAKAKLRSQRADKLLNFQQEQEVLGSYLQTEALKKSHKFARELQNVRCKSEVIFKGHTKTITTVQLSQDKHHLFSASKDSSIIKWDVQSRSKTFLSRDNSEHHQKQILCSALSEDGTLYATGGAQGQILLWDTRRDVLAQRFKAHRSAVNCLKFGLNSKKLASSGDDRAFKIWDCIDMVAIDTFYGHADHTNSIDALSQHDFISGGYDQQFILWRTQKQAQMLFQSHAGSLDCVKALSSQRYISGSQEGTLSLWNVKRKKAANVLEKVHGKGWITAVGGVFNTNICASASYNGKINVYKVSGDNVKRYCQWPSQGVANEMSWSREGEWLALAEGEQHRLGSWFRVKAKNQIRLMNLQLQL